MKWYCGGCFRKPERERTLLSGAVIVTVRADRTTPCPRCCGWTTAARAAERAA